MTRTRVQSSQGSEESLSSDVTAASTSPEAPARAARAPYRAPKLRHLGSVRELTLGGTMGKTETLGSFRTM